MTVVAYRDGILCSDSQVQAGVTTVGTYKKIHRTKDGFLFGVAGALAHCSQFIDWFQEENTPEKPSLQELNFKSGFEALIISPDGSVGYLDESGFPMEFQSKFYAIGSGAELALGAMAAGATSEEAVKIAIEWCNSCGGKVQKLKL